MNKTRRSIRLGVNIDHCATLRQVRGGQTPYPDILKMAQISVRGGAEQITIHLREDRRHIQENDVAVLCRERPAIINLEMGATLEMKKMALKYQPDWVCFVPEKRRELTTEGGLDVEGQLTKLKKISGELQRKGIEVSMFIDPAPKQVRASFKAGAEAVELHTGSWVLALQAKNMTKAQNLWRRLVESAKLAHQLGLRVHAGHGLDYVSTKKIIVLPHLQELNIGHSLVCHALELGLEKSVRKMCQTMNGF